MIYIYILLLHFATQLINMEQKNIAILMQMSCLFCDNFFLNLHRLFVEQTLILHIT